MSCLQMAWRSCIRKPVKSLLLLLVVFIISIFLLSGLATKDANVSIEDKTRQAIGAGFLMVGNDANRHQRMNEISAILGEEEGELEGLHQKKSMVNGQTVWQSWTDNSFETLNIEEINKIAEVAGISDFNIATGTTAVNPVNFHRIEDKDVDQSADVLGVNLIGNKDMAMDANVLAGNIIMLSGRMVQSDDVNVCVISEELATYNQFTIGDKLQFNDYHDRENATVYEADIIGIYQRKQKTTPSMSGDTYRLENVIFTDLRFPEKAEGNVFDPLFEKAYFKVEDVNLYESIKEEIKKVDITWERYDFIDNNGNLETMSTNFNDLQSFSNILIYVVASASFIILFLVFVFWLKSRVQEIGILLSLGISKLKIIVQISLEAIIITWIAIGLSFLIAPQVSKITANYLVDQRSQQAEENKTLERGQVATDYVAAEQVVNDVYVRITIPMMSLNAVGITLLVIISVMIASMTILRKKPNDILSELV